MTFIRGIDIALHVREEFVSLFGFHGTETGKGYS
jgi:hypothetical protein